LVNKLRRGQIVHPTVFNTFEEICSTRGISGAVLEIGAMPEPMTLLNLPSLAGAREKIGINISGGSRCDGVAILKVDANDMSCFPDQHFDAVLCNAMLEHDRYFWKTLAEIRRVVRIGGLVVIGAPGYRRSPRPSRFRRLLAKVSAERWPIRRAAPTFPLHNFPGDYYRFSEQAFREVFFEGMCHVTIRTVMNPPRFIGAGTRV
jgi:SAM-dependent methyltransferase